MKLLLCNVAWMKWYNGITDDDWPINGGEFVEKNGYGHEVLNFQKNGRYVYGYVQARKGTIDINRLDPNSENYVDDVLIAWRAKSSEGAVIIGWYKNARVFRHGQGQIQNVFSSMTKNNIILNGIFVQIIKMPS